MQEYKLVNALPNSLPGNFEDHYGYKCEIRKDGIYIQLDDLTATNWAAAGRITRAVTFAVVPEPVVVDDEPVEEVVDEKPQTMKDVVENGYKKPGRPAKKAE